MKIIPHLLFAVMVCILTSNVALADAFADFRAEAQRKIPSGWVCGEVRTIEGRTLFDISSPKNRFTIIITRHKLISQDEWNLRSKRVKRTVDSILAGKEIKEVESLKNGMDLPDGRFGDTALGIDMSEPELHYPEIGADDLAAKAVVKTLLRIIKPYKKSEPCLLTGHKHSNFASFSFQSLSQEHSKVR